MIDYTDSYWNDLKKTADNLKNKETLFNKRIFITGCNGLICSSAVDLLFCLNKFENAGIEIILASRSKDRTEQRFKHSGCTYTWLSYDANKPLQGSIDADFIICGASNANPAKYESEPVETMLSNVIGINELLNAIKGTKTRFVYISSSEVNGITDNTGALLENEYGYVNIDDVRSCYPTSKRAAELLCRSYIQEYSNDIVIVRPGHIYGPQITDSDNRANAQFTRNVADNKDIVMKSKGNQLRSYCYSLDCASAILAVMISGKTGESYNISNKDSIVTIAELAKNLAIAGNRKIVFDIPSELEAKGYNKMTNSSLDSSKIEELGWNAIFSIEEGTAKTIKHYINKK